MPVVDGRHVRIFLFVTGKRGLSSIDSSVAANARIAYGEAAISRDRYKRLKCAIINFVDD